MIGGAVKEASVRVRMLEGEARSMDKLRGMEAERRREGIQEDDLVMRTLVAIIAGRGKSTESSTYLSRLDNKFLFQMWSCLRYPILK